MTQDQSLEDIDDLFSKSWSKRANVAYYLKWVMLKLCMNIHMISFLYSRFGCFISSSGICKRRLVQVETFDDSEESEQLQEPLDQISMSSVDGVEPDEDCETKPVVV